MLFDLKRHFLISFCCQEIKIPESSKINKCAKNKCDIHEDTNIKLIMLKKKTSSIYHSTSAFFSPATNKPTEPYSNIQPVATGSSESASHIQPDAELSQVTNTVTQNNNSLRKRIDSSVDKVPNKVPPRLSLDSPYRISPKRPTFPMLDIPSVDMLMPETELVTDDLSSYATNNLTKM